MTIHISMKSGLFLAIILVALTGFDKGFEIIKERGATYQQVTRPQITDWVEVSPDGQKSPLDIHYPGAQSIWLYRHKYNQAVYALLIIYTHEQQGAELINSANRIFETRGTRGFFKLMVSFISSGHSRIIARKNLLKSIAHVHLRHSNRGAGKPIPCYLTQERTTYR